MLERRFKPHIEDAEDVITHFCRAVPIFQLDHVQRHVTTLVRKERALKVWILGMAHVWSDADMVHPLRMVFPESFSPSELLWVDHCKRHAGERYSDLRRRSQPYDRRYAIELIHSSPRQQGNGFYVPSRPLSATAYVRARWARASKIGV